MDSSSLLLSVLSMIGVRLPVLIALCVGLVWVVGAPRDAARSGALAGLVLLLVANLGGVVANVVPLWMVSNGDFTAISAMSAVLGGVQFVLSLLSAFGIVLVIWALVRVLRSRQVPPPPPAR